MGINQLPTDVQAFAHRLIRRKARQLANHDNFTPSDRDDIAQDLWLHLFENLPKFDPDKGNIFAFIVTVVERETAAIWRKYRAESDSIDGRLSSGSGDSLVGIGDMLIALGSGHGGCPPPPPSPLPPPPPSPVPLPRSAREVS